MANYNLRYPASIKAAIEKLIGNNEASSINQFFVMAAAEKIAALDTARLFEERGQQADLNQALAILRRNGGAPIQPGDEK